MREGQDALRRTEFIPLRGKTQGDGINSVLRNGNGINSVLRNGNGINSVLRNGDGINSVLQNANGINSVLRNGREGRAGDAIRRTSLPVSLARGGSSCRPPCPERQRGTRPSPQLAAVFRPSSAWARNGPRLPGRIPRKSSSPGPRPNRFPDGTGCPSQTSLPWCSRWPR